MSLLIPQFHQLVDLFLRQMLEPARRVSASTREELMAPIVVGRARRGAATCRRRRGAAPHLSLFPLSTTFAAAGALAAGSRRSGPRGPNHLFLVGFGQVHMQPGASVLGTPIMIEKPTCFSNVLIFVRGWLRLGFRSTAVGGRSRLLGSLGLRLLGFPNLGLGSFLGGRGVGGQLVLQVVLLLKAVTFLLLNPNRSSDTIPKIGTIPLGISALKTIVMSNVRIKFFGDSQFLQQDTSEGWF